jgi:TonB-linked SusC/RagA family outer membrane protein
MKKFNFLLITIFSLLLTVSSYAQEKTVTGKVTSQSDGTALPGVNIIVQGTSRGAQTDFEGNYSITASVGEVLNFSFIGMKAVSITVGDSNVINVVLEEDAASLDEVVVTALGISREKKSLGYAVTELQSDEINTIKDHNVANSLVGKVAGVVINQSGGVGSASRIVIRGNNSLTGNNQALIVVDGIPIDVSGSESGGSVYSSSVTGGGITDINPDDVESISILKGPNAAALYGSRASNGVVLITTKKGSKNKALGITINSNITIENTMFLPDYQNEYGQGTNGDFTISETTNASYPEYVTYTLNSGASWGPRLDGSQKPYFTGLNDTRSYVAQPDNVKDFFETGIKSINSIALDKGGDDFSVRFSYTNDDTKSIMPNSSLLSHNLNLRTNYDLSDKWNVDTKATYFTQKLNNRISLGSEGVLAYVYGMPRNIVTSDLEDYMQKPNPSLYIPGTITDYDVVTYNGIGTSTGNPYWMLKKDKNVERRDRFLGFAKITHKFNDWISAFIRVGGDITNVRQEGIVQVGNHFSRWGSIGASSSKYTEINSDFLLTANKDITEKLNLVANVGGNLSKRTYETIGFTASRFLVPTSTFLDNTEEKIPNTRPLRIKKVNSLYASFNFSYDNFMYLDITGRNDWSSTLPENNRSFFYPSINYSILVDRFIDPDKNTFDYLKLRGSWAEVGNDTDPYLINQTYEIPSQGYLGLTVLNAPNVELNPNLKPESIVSTELGIEARMFKSRLYADFSIYKINSKDLILTIPAPTGYEYPNLLVNVGEVENKGVEFLIGGSPVRTENFNWDVSFNFSKNKNKLLELVEGIDSSPLNASNSGNLITRSQVGGSIGDMYGTVWATDENGNKLVTDNGLPLASNPDNYLGNSQPDWIGGITNTLSYKNLTMRFLIDGRFGGEIYSMTSASLDGNGVSERSLLYRESGVVLDALVNGTTTQNTSSITGQQYWQSYSGIAENYIYDQTNIRLREFSLSYNLPSKLIQNAGLNSASIGLIGRNLFFFYKKADDIDPEATLGTALSAQGISLNNVPTIRSVGLNINLKF